MKVIKNFIFVFVCFLLMSPISKANETINFNQPEKIIKEVEVHLSLNQASIAFNKLKDIEKMATNALSKNTYDEKSMFVLRIFYYFRTYIGELGWDPTAAESFAHSASGGVFN